MIVNTKTKEMLVAELEQRVADKILEPTNAELLKKLIKNADNDNEAMMIAELGTTYKQTGFQFDKRLEKMTDSIRYFKKSEPLSFRTDDNKPTNKLVIGDNYEALQNLLIQYRGKVDVIYIDPPYGKDSIGEFAKTNYENAITRDNLLSMLYPRLQLAKQLLSDIGIIFCSIDDKNHAYVKCLFDEIFGESNFEGQIHWRRRNNQPNDKNKLIGIVAEHILAYSKNLIEHKLFGVGKVDLTGSFSNPDNDPRGPWASKPWKTGDSQSGTRYEIISPTGKVFLEEWMGEKSLFESLMADNRIVFPKNGNGLPRKKYYESERIEEGQCASNWWSNKDFGCNQDATNELKSLFNSDTIFKNPKPVSLLKALCQLGSIKQNSIILDFFAGSGTIGHAVLDLNKQDGGNRTFILCQLNENLDKALESGDDKSVVEKQIALCDKYNRPHELSEITAERLRRIMTGKCFDGATDFNWLSKNEPYNGNLEVYEIAEVASTSAVERKSPFDVIDETLYGKSKFTNLQEKIEWICSNFSNARYIFDKSKLREV